jgi:predicted anti-sigma-YlaC factor YlaD
MQVRPFPTDDCSSTVQRLSLRVDGELSELGEARLEAHLRECAECRGIADRLEGATIALRAAPPEPVAIPFVLPRRPLAGAYALRSASAVAAVAAVFAVSVFVGLTGVIQPYIAPARVPAAQVRAAHRVLAVKNYLLNQLEGARWQSRAIRPSLAAAEATTVRNAPGAGSASLSTGRSTSNGR